jgi:hypothetical protein
MGMPMRVVAAAATTALVAAVGAATALVGVAGAERNHSETCSSLGRLFVTTRSK